ncbi:MAG: hypothetical protein IT208_17300 [Chthonomonadales bacterium]|nr:hypothetical protein [Chthonomonadales bacterium]
MTPREVILRNLQCADAPRIGMDFGGGRWNDFRGASIAPSPSWRQRRWTEGKVEFYDDEWGNLWHRVVGMSSGGEVSRPALEDWSALDSYRLPDLAAPERFAPAAERFAEDDGHFRVGWLPGFPFAICRYLRKMENYFQDLVLERERVDVLHERVCGLLERMIVRYADAGADGVMFCEDWGVQDRLLIRPAMWREVFRPMFERLCGAARAREMHVLMHSCGCVRDIIGDLAAVGVSALQFDQPALHGLEWLAERLGSLRVCLYSPVDIQRVLPGGDRERIEEEARRMCALFDGRLIAKNYPDLHGIGVLPEWDGWAYEVFERAASAGRAVAARSPG